MFDHHLAHAGMPDGRCSWPTVISAFVASKRSTLNRLREERCHLPLVNIITSGGGGNGPVAVA
jgi:hypothetical protein